MLDDERLIGSEGRETMFGLVIPHHKGNGSGKIINGLRKVLIEKGIKVISEAELPEEKMKSFRDYQQENGTGIILKIKRTLNELQNVLEIVKPAAMFIPENCII